MLVTISAVYVMEFIFFKLSLKQYFDIEQTQIKQEALEGLVLLKKFFDEEKIKLSREKLESFRVDLDASKFYIEGTMIDRGKFRQIFSRKNIHLFPSQKSPFSYLLVMRKNNNFFAKKIIIRDVNLRYFSNILQNGVNLISLKDTSKLTKARVFFDEKEKIFFYDRAGDFVDIYLQIADTSYVKISTSRDFYTLVKGGAYRNLLFSTLTILFIFLMFYVLIVHFVLLKIWKISSRMKKIKQSSDLSLRVELGGKDEVGQMAIFIDSMLESIEKARKKEMQEKDGQIESEKNFLQQIIDSSKSSLIVVNEKDIIRTNYSFHSVFGYIFSLSEAKRKTFVESLLSASQDEIVNLKSNRGDQYSFFKVDKTLLDLESKHLITITDISSLGKQMQDLRKTSFLDPLTNTLNRKGMLSALAQNYKDKVFALLMFDIDFFKKINDNYGHPAGDEVLRIFADMLINNSRSKDIVSRIGGEEFVFIFICDNIDVLKQTAERLRKKTQRLKIQTDSSTSISVTVSIGGILCADNMNFDKAYEQADKNLYRAKEGGRNQSVITQKNIKKINI